MNATVIRDREKVMRGLKRMDTPILKGHQLYHNFIRPHKGLKGETQATKAGIRLALAADVTAVLECKVISGEMTSNNESIDLRNFSEAELKSLQTSPWARLVLRDAFAQSQLRAFSPHACLPAIQTPSTLGA